MSNNGKSYIKTELINRINKILNENQIQEIDKLTTISLNKETAYLRTIAIFDYSKFGKIENELNNIFKDYGSFSLKTKEIVSCCKPSYKNISFKVNVGND